MVIDTFLNPFISQEFLPLIDLMPSYLCTTPSNTKPLEGVMVEVSRGNCTFVEKGYVAQKAGAKATVVISDSDVVS